MALSAPDERLAELIFLGRPHREIAAAAGVSKVQGYRIMVGCMLATSLAMAPAILVAQDAAFVDLDGPLLLKRDRPEGLRYEGSTLHPPEPALWG